MKDKIQRHWQKLAIGVLAILLVLASLQIYELSVRITDLQSNYTNSINSLSDEINSIYNNVDEKLKEQASLLSFVECEYGKLDSKNNTVDVTIRVVPKVVTDDMELSTKIGKDNIGFVRKGNEFIAKADVDVFVTGDEFPILNLKTSDETKTELLTDVDVYNLRYSYIDSVYSDSSLSAFFDKGALRLEGNISFYCESPNGDENPVKSVHIVQEINGKEIENKDVTNEMHYGNYDEFYDKTYKDISEGDMLNIYAVVNDSRGYIHKVGIISVEGVSGFSEPQQCYSDGAESIYDKDGNLLY